MTTKVSRMENCLFCLSSQLFFVFNAFFLRLQFLSASQCSVFSSHVQIATFKYHQKVKFFRCRSFHFSLLLILTLISVFLPINFIIFTKTISIYTIFFSSLPFNPNWLYVNVDFNSIRSAFLGYITIYTFFCAVQWTKTRNVFKLHAAHNTEMLTVWSLN